MSKGEGRKEEIQKELGLSVRIGEWHRLMCTMWGTRTRKVKGRRTRRRTSSKREKKKKKKGKKESKKETKAKACRKQTNHVLRSGFFCWPFWRTRKTKNPTTTTNKTHVGWWVLHVGLTSGLKWEQDYI